MAVSENFLTVFHFLSITAITSIIWLVFQHYYKNLRIFQLGRKLPGPKPWPLIGNAWDFLGSDLDIIAKLKKFRDFKKLFAVWLGHKLNVFISSPDLAEIYCKSNSLLYRTDRVRFLDFAMGKGLLLANGADWKKAKKIVEISLPYSLIKKSIPLFQKQAEILTDVLQKEVGKPCFPSLFYVEERAFDIICDLTLGSEIKNRTLDFSIVENINLIYDLLRKKLYNALYQLNFIYKLFPEGKLFYSEIYKLLNFVDDVVVKEKTALEEEEMRLKNGEISQKSNITMFLKTLLDDETIDVNRIKDHLGSIILAGFHPASNSISCTLILLALHPEIQEKAYQEVKSVIKKDFTYENIQKLEYLDMVVKESLRLFPTVPITYRTATEDVQFGDYLVPEGADVSLNIYELHRDPEQYENPHEFNPDHFLPEKVAKRHPYAFIPFLIGLRNCVGGKMAMMVIRIIVAKLLLSYKFECDYKTIDDIKFRGDISIRLNDGGLVRITRRQ